MTVAIDPNQQQILDFLRLLAQYNSGVVNAVGSGSSSSSGSQSNFRSAERAQNGPEVARSAPTPNVSRQTGLAAALANFGAIATQNPELGNIASALNFTSAVSNPNASVGSVAPSVLGALGYGPAASLASMAQNGFTTSNVLGLLGSTVNPAFGLIGLANSLSGGSLGNSVSSLGNTLGNPDSMGALSNVGVSYGDQIGNSLNNDQIGMDTESMDSLSNSFSGDGSTSDTGSDSDSDSRGQGSNSDGSDGSSNQG